MDWTNILKTIGTNAIFIAVLGFVAKSIFTQFLSRDIENHKIKLQANYDNEIEKLRFDLSKLAFEHQIVFSKLHETRAEVIAKLYELLVEAEATYDGLASDYVFTEKADTDKETFKDTSRAWLELGYFFSRKKIYFDEAFCRKMSKLLSTYISSDMLYLSLQRASENLENAPQEFIEKAKNEIPKIKYDMENEFRKLLGIQE